MENYQKEYTKRRNLHNQLIELKGNIRVFCRVRPPLLVEIQSGDYEEIISYRNENEVNIDV